MPSFPPSFLLMVATPKRPEKKFPREQKNIPISDCTSDYPSRPEKSRRSIYFPPALLISSRSLKSPLDREERSREPPTNTLVTSASSKSRRSLKICKKNLLLESLKEPSRKFSEHALLLESLLMEKAPRTLPRMLKLENLAFKKW